MFPQWLTKDADFKRIFKTKFLPEDVGIRKDPDQRTDKNLRIWERGSIPISI